VSARQRKKFFCDLCVFAVNLFCSAFSQVFGKIRQPDHYDSQADDIPGIDSAVKHSGNNRGKRQAHNGSDYENRNRIHFNIPALILIISVDTCRL
jgi:hypothetical protein